MRGLKIQDSYTITTTNSLTTYFNEVSKIKLLDVDEEYEIAYLAHQGDALAKQKLVKHNLRFVISVAKQYDYADVSLEDLINEGNVGLIIASERFDPSKGFKFISYAVWWIRRTIQSYIIDNGVMIRLPNNKSIANYKIKQRCISLEQKLQYKPSYNDFIKTYGKEFSSDEIAFYFNTLDSGIKSLDEPVGNDDSSSTMSDLMCDTNLMDTSYFVNKEDEEKDRMKLLNVLTKNIEREVINYLYGFDGKDSLSLKTTGFVLGLSSERVRQIRDRALNKIQVYLEK